MSEAPTTDKSGVSDRYSTVYSPTFLTRIYDTFVLRFNMRYMWGCPTDTILLPYFSENFSRNHLDVGVATGFFPAVALARPWRSTAADKQRLTLVDIQPNSLQAARLRVQAAAPGIDVDCVEADVTAPLPPALEGRSFDSISMFNLFHCVPGGADRKLRALATYKDLLAEGGVLTGCTVLGTEQAWGWLSRLYVTYFNSKGVFNNLHDRKEDFQRALEENFEEVESWVFGMTFMFRAAKPRRSTLIGEF